MTGWMELATVSCAAVFTHSLLPGNLHTAVSVWLQSSQTPVIILSDIVSASSLWGAWECKDVNKRVINHPISPDYSSVLGCAEFCKVTNDYLSFLFASGWTEIPRSIQNRKLPIFCDSQIRFIHGIRSDQATQGQLVFYTSFFGYVFLFLSYFL